MELIIDKLEDLHSAAQQLIEFAEDRKKWIFIGDIGAGKTTFIQTICNILGVKEKVTSPTYSIINEYAFLNKNDKTELIHHIDLYRLKNLDEALDIGIEDHLYDENYCFIEWPQVIKPLLPEPLLEINLQIIENSKRKIIFL